MVLWTYLQLQRNELLSKIFYRNWYLRPVQQSETHSMARILIFLEKNVRKIEVLNINNMAIFTQVSAQVEVSELISSEQRCLKTWLLWILTQGFAELKIKCWSDVNRAVSGKSSSSESALISHLWNIAFSALNSTDSVLIFYWISFDIYTSRWEYQNLIT